MNIQTPSQIERQNVLGCVDEIIDLLDEKSIRDLLQGSGSDIDNLYSILIEETHNVVNLNSTQLNSSELNYLPNLKIGYEHYLRCYSLNYFVCNCLPEFDLAPHCIEWFNMIQSYKYLCIIASRDHSKSYSFSFAHIIWKLYRYEKPTELYIPPLDIKLCKEGMLITNEYSLAKRLLKKVKQEIENNPFLQERMLPDKSNSGWGETALTCKNGSEITLSSFHSTNRGPHPGWIVVDDFLDKSALYSKDAREKFREVFMAEVLNMIQPQGTVDVVGCVNENTLILTRDRGFVRIGSFNKSETKSLIDLQVEVSDKDNFSLTSKFFNNGIVPTKKIRVEYGYELECSLIHPLRKIDSTGIFWEKSQNLQVGDWVSLSFEEKEWGGELSLKYILDLQEEIVNSTCNIRKINLPEFLNEDLSYLIGIYIAEGCFSNNCVTITTTDLEVVEFLQSLQKYNIIFSRNRILPNWSCSSRILSELFKFLGVEERTTSVDKRVPERLLSIKKSLLRSLVQGIFDGDGCCLKKFPYEVILTSTSTELISQLQILLIMGWGIRSYITKQNIEKQKTFNSNSRLRVNYDLYNLHLPAFESQLFREKIGFRIQRKNLRPKISSKQVNKVPFFHKVLRESLEELREKNLEYYNSLKGRYKYITDRLKEETINKDILVEFIDVYSKGCNLSTTQQLRDISDSNIYWVKILNIEDSISNTVDFVIPKSHSFISNGFLSHNTPFHEKDLYADLKKDPTWKVFEYPAIFPDGRILYDFRYDYEALVSKRKSLGSLIFSREILVKPITDNVSIFPWNILEISFVNMQSLRLVQNRESYPIKFKKVALGCDFALSSSVGADNTVFTVVGLDSLDQIHLIHSTTLHGASYNEQLNHIQRIATNFQPDTVVMEVNGFQRIMADLAKQRGVQNIIEFNTTGFNKKDLYEGLPSLAVLFETGVIKFPRGDEESIQVTDAYCSELNSIAFDDTKGTLESVSEHDDKGMSLFFSIKGLRTINSSFKISMI